MSLPEHVALGKFDRSVSLLAWGYNEELLIEQFIDQAVYLLEAAVADWEIVFVDDCSTDRTPEILTRRAAREPRIRIVRHQQNMNVGVACRTAVAHASKDIILWQTVDWSYDISRLRIFLELTKYFDVVQGIRPVPIRLLSYVPILRSIYRIRRRSDNLYKALISLGNYYALRLLYGVHFHDFQNVTIYPRELAQSLKLGGCTSFVNPEMLMKAYYRGARFIEVPIPFVARSRGIAKGTKPTVVIRSILDTARNWLAWGAANRITLLRNPGQPIARISYPFSLDQRVLPLVLPLFDDFR